MRTLVLTLAVVLSPIAAAAETPENEVRAVITAFEDGMRDRNIAHVQKTVSSDIVVLQDGLRIDGWEEVRDHRLIPEFAHAPSPYKWAIVKINASADMGWAYAKNTVSLKSKRDFVSWTVFVLERRGKEWKIVLLDSTAPRAAASRSPKTRH